MYKTVDELVDALIDTSIRETRTVRLQDEFAGCSWGNIDTEEIATALSAHADDNSEEPDFWGERDGQEWRVIIY